MHRNIAVFAVFITAAAIATILILRTPNDAKPHSVDVANSTEAIEDSTIENLEAAPSSQQAEPAGQEIPGDDAPAADQISTLDETQTLATTSVFPTNTFYYTARHLIITRYGEFIRDLPLSPSEKQEVRRLMMEVQAHNTALGQSRRSGEITDLEFFEQRLQMEEELSRLLEPELIETYKEAERRTGDAFREQMAETRSRIVNNNLQRISGLTEENKELFLSRLIEANGGQSAQNFYEDSVLSDVRNQLADLFDSDQLEVVDIFIESERTRRAQINAMSQGNQDYDSYSSRYLTNARSNINSNYGEFIRDLPLSPEQKQAVRALMVDVTARNADLMEAQSNGQISIAEMSSRFMNMETELENILDAKGMQLYSEYEQQRREEMAIAAQERQQQMLRDNLQSISGLTEDNWQLFTSALAEIEPMPSAGFRFQPNTIQQARDQIVGSLDSDQLEIIEIYLAESTAFQRNIEERQQRRQGNSQCIHAASRLQLILPY